MLFIIEFIPMLILGVFWYDLACKDGSFWVKIPIFMEIFLSQKVLVACSLRYALLVKINCFLMYVGGIYGVCTRFLHFPITTLSIYLYLFAGIFSLLLPIAFRYKKIVQMKEYVEEFEKFIEKM